MQVGDKVSKPTAVEWLEKEFNKLEATVGVYGIMYSLIDQAKAMEKEQIHESFVKGFNSWDETFGNKLIENDKTN